MVEHRIRDPQVVDLTEETAVLVESPEGPCLVCGRWIDGEEADVFAVRLSKISGDAREYVSHISCLTEVVDPSAKLP